MKGTSAMRFMEPEQLALINDRSLDLLEEVGVRIEHQGVTSTLLGAGCRELPSGMIAFPRELVAECIGHAPSVVNLAPVAGETTQVGPDGRTVFWTGNALYHAEGGEMRPITEPQFVALTRVADALDRVQAVVGPTISEIPAQFRDFVGCRLLAQHTTKHLRPCIYTPRGGAAIIEMGRVLASPATLRERPVVSFGYTIVSPLRWTEPGLEMFVQTSGHGVPMMINSEPTAGATSPVTLGGTLMLANAEALSGVVIIQTLEPGRPCVFNLGFAHAMDMRQAVTRTGAPENGLLGAVGAELARFHGLPSASWMSTEAMIADEQAAWEKMNVGLMHAMAGVNIIWGIGQLESQRTLSPEMMVIDDEIAAACLRAARGVATDDEALAYEVVAELGAQADYLGHRHTLAHFREELFEPSLGFVGRREGWEAEGAATARERARERVREILGAPEAQRLSEDVERELLRIEERWREKLR
ncbi:MAG: trimethylamine methyltransferase family protein [Armatimonadota bacterium]